MKKITGLDYFRYCKVNSSFKLYVNSDLDYFKNEIHEKVRWKSEKINLSTTKDNPAFDSGIVCATSDNLPFKLDEISELNCFFAPYKLMKETIGTISEHSKKRKTSPNTDNLGIAIGMVLSIIATKGSAENGNNTPYMLFIKRGNIGIRSQQLDVPIVEGLNCGDFEKDNTGKYCAELSKIAKRAVEEERGLNVGYLISKGLLHMPEKYYFGYDSDYCQWNFFGTVVIDCTIEEIIRQGCYYTKDKFESKEIIGIPAEPNILYYYLSEHMIPIHNRKGESEKVDMWNTAWASVAFAMFNFYDEKTYKNPQRKCLIRKKFPKVFNGLIRSFFNRIATILTSKKHGLEFVCAVVSMLLFISFVISTVNNIFENTIYNSVFLSCLENFMSLLTTVLASWIVVAVVRNDIINRNDIIKLNTNLDSKEKQLYKFPEISVFRNVELIDGNIAEKVRKVNFTFELKRDLCGEIASRRKCQLSYNQNDGELAWGMHSFIEENVEDFLWVVKCCEDTTNNMRIVAPLIIKNHNIMFNSQRTQSDEISHYVDFEIPYKMFAGKSGIDIEKILMKEIKKHLNRIYSFNVTIQFKFLLNYNNQSVVVAFLESDIPSTKMNALNYDLTETTFSQKFKDDVTRVACEYAIADYIGYKMSSR